MGKGLERGLDSMSMISDGDRCYIQSGRPILWQSICKTSLYCLLKHCRIQEHTFLRVTQSKIGEIFTEHQTGAKYFIYILPYLTCTVLLFEIFIYLAVLGLSCSMGNL